MGPTRLRRPPAPSARRTRTQPRRPRRHRVAARRALPGDAPAGAPRVGQRFGRAAAGGRRPGARGGRHRRPAGDGGGRVRGRPSEVGSSAMLELADPAPVDLREPVRGAAVGDRLAHPARSPRGAPVGRAGSPTRTRTRRCSTRPRPHGAAGCGPGSIVVVGRRGHGPAAHPSSWRRRGPTRSAGSRRLARPPRGRAPRGVRRPGPPPAGPAARRRGRGRWASTAAACGCGWRPRTATTTCGWRGAARWRRPPTCCVALHRQDEHLRHGRRG